VGRFYPRRRPGQLFDFHLLLRWVVECCSFHTRLHTGSLPVPLSFIGCGRESNGASGPEPDRPPCISAYHTRIATQESERSEGVVAFGIFRASSVDDATPTTLAALR